MKVCYSIGSNHKHQQLYLTRFSAIAGESSPSSNAVEAFVNDSRPLNKHWYYLFFILKQKLFRSDANR